MGSEKRGRRCGAVIHRGALGDFITTLPVYSGLKSLYPGLRLHFHSKPAHSALLREMPYFDGASAADSADLNAFHCDDGWQTAPVPPWLRSRDFVFFLGKKSSRPVAHRLRLRLKVPVHWIESFPDPSVAIPVGRHLVEQVRACGYPIPDDLPRLLVGGEERRWIRDWLQKNRLINRTGVVVHPGSGGLSKVWPLDRWRVLLQRLAARPGPRTVIALGPADEPLAPFAAMLENRGHLIVRHWPVTRLAALLASARLYIGNDSGVTHLAAALGVPTIAIFGPASHAAWHPRGKRVVIVRDRWDPGEAFQPASGKPCDLPPELLRAIDCILD